MEWAGGGWWGVGGFQRQPEPRSPTDLIKEASSKLGSEHPCGGGLDLVASDKPGSHGVIEVGIPMLRAVGATLEIKVYRRRHRSPRGVCDVVRHAPVHLEFSAYERMGPAIVLQESP